MSRARRPALVLAAALAAVGVLYVFVRGHGFDARKQPGRFEKAVAVRLRALVIPDEARRLANPVQATDDVRRDGLAHFADHCAICHGNDGSGDTAFGRGLYPKPPDLRQPATQRLTDGELFYIIEHGVRFTGMPGWRTDTLDGQETTWHLVNFIRHLPAITPEEVAAMEGINPRPPAEVRQEIEAERFLQGEDVPPSSEGAGHAH